MGYSTSFTGRFQIVPDLEMPLYARLMDLADDNKRKEAGALDGYCQWRPTRDGQHLEWDGGEKFYEYVEWAQFIHDRILVPNGHALIGSVAFQGEDRRDRGVLTVVNGTVVRQKQQPPLASKIEPHAHSLFALVEEAMVDNEFGSEWNKKANAVMESIRGAK